ncbi:MAG: hypothetical protein JRF15_08905 [Deltaproteobacteria bacterium]|jgi:hypothetical protein|nr:hypothetical protein [Deltaproteobacteria bacterium]
MASEIEQLERDLIQTAIIRLRSRVFAMVFGMLCGTGLFVATAWLVIRKGLNVGLHLNLLSNYFPGYSVTWPGAFIGFFYGALFGAFIGWSVAWVYNQIAHERSPS